MLAAGTGTVLDVLVDDVLVDDVLDVLDVLVDAAVTVDGGAAVTVDASDALVVSAPCSTRDAANVATAAATTTTPTPASISLLARRAFAAATDPAANARASIRSVKLPSTATATPAAASTSTTAPGRLVAPRDANAPNSAGEPDNASWANTDGGAKLSTATDAPNPPPASSAQQSSHIGPTRRGAPSPSTRTSPGRTPDTLRPHATCDDPLPRVHDALTDGPLHARFLRDEPGRSGSPRRTQVHVVQPPGGGNL